MNLPHFDCCCHFLSCLCPAHIRGKMASGIQVTERVKTIFETMKVRKNEDDSSQRLRIVTFTIRDDSIDVDKKISESDLSGTDAFIKFSELLVETECFYFLYDCHYVNKEGIPKEDLIFGSWVPGFCGIKSKLIYASSRNAIKMIFKGIKYDLQMHDLDDFKNRDAFAQQLDKNCIISVEGKPVK